MWDRDLTTCPHLRSSASPCPSSPCKPTCSTANTFPPCLSGHYPISPLQPATLHFSFSPAGHPTALAHRPVSIYLQPSGQLFPFSSAGTSSPKLPDTTPAHSSGYLLHLSPAATNASQSSRPHFPLCHRPVPSAHSSRPLHLPTAGATPLHLPPASPPQNSSRPLHFICHRPVHHRTAVGH